MSLHSVGSDTHYILPSSHDSIPEAFRSCKAAKPIPCSLQTVNVPSLSGTQSLGGSSVVQIPCGASAGVMMNPYLRFTVQFSSAAAVANSSFFFKGAAQAATAAIQSVLTSVNSVQIDNQQNAWALYDALLTHSTSNDWLTHDGTLMLGAGVQYFQPLPSGSTSSGLYTFAVPLLGMLGSQQAMPLYLVNGTLQVQINWQSIITAIYQAGSTDPLWTGVSFSNVQMVYDKVMPEQAFVDKVRHDMMSGAKYVFSYTNYATVSLPTTAAGQYNLNYGLNVSSLRGVIATQYATTALTTSAAGNSISNGMSQFQVSLDGRLISSLALNSITDPVLVFAELQKAFGRIFDASITDPVVNTSTAAAAGTTGNVSGGNFVTQYYAAGASAQRVNEGLAFQGSPCSILNIQTALGSAGNGTAYVASTLFFIIIADFQMLCDATGSVELVR